MNANFIKSTALIAALVLSGCATQQEPLCDREAIEWDKYGTAEVPKECRPNLDVVELCCEPTQEPPTQGPPRHPPMPEPPKQEPPTDTPTGKKKDDNSDANGRGGNKHNRADKDRTPQEIAEDKKVAK